MNCHSDRSLTRITAPNEAEEPAVLHDEPDNLNRNRTSRAKVMRSKITMSAGAFIFAVFSLLEVASISGTLRQLAGSYIAESLSTRTIFFVMLGGLFVLAVAWFDRKVETHEPDKLNQPTNDIVTSNLGSASIQNQTANPVTTQSVAIHNYPPQAISSTQILEKKNEPHYNIKFLDLQKTKTADPLTEISPTADGFWAIKTGFLNKSIPQVKIDDYEYVRARMVFFDSENREVFSTSKPVWLGHGDNSGIHLDVNTPEYLLLAVFGNDRTWAVPFKTIRRTADWEYGEQTMIDRYTLRPEQGPFKVEITLVGKDNVGLEPVTGRFDIGPDGDVQVYPQ